ncbi:hypothetical protein F2Q69_00047828 [Brassica cretica]|uniref:BURP domain-containing protein n=1 Tax=Brassica cretica TaxID=69181 RepID=A0A8S9PK95_BRACR|nr:hypothetical protein F2Q69_00047828 [Brassica cretica]
MNSPAKAMESLTLSLSTSLLVLLSKVYPDGPFLVPGCYTHPYVYGLATKGSNNDKIKEGKKSDQTVKSIAGIEHWPDLATISIKPSLPRRFKAMHKIVPDKSMVQIALLGPGSYHPPLTCLSVHLQCQTTQLAVLAECSAGSASRLATPARPASSPHHILSV